MKTRKLQIFYASNQDCNNEYIEEFFNDKDVFLSNNSERKKQQNLKKLLQMIRFLFQIFQQIKEIETMRDCWVY